MSEMGWVFLILMVTTVCFLVPRFRSDLVAVCALLVLILMDLLTLPEAFAGFSNSVVLMIAALFIVGEGVFQSGLANKAGQLLVKWTGNSEFKLMLFMMLLVALLSGFISNTGTVAILLPVVVSLSRQMGLHPGKLLMPLAFASSMGGALTLIGTAPNLIASQSLAAAGFGALTFFDFTSVGLIILLVGMAYLWLVGRKLLDKPVEQEASQGEAFSGDALLGAYQAKALIHTTVVPEKHYAVGLSLKELRWPNSYGVTVLEVRRKVEARKFRLPNLPGLAGEEEGYEELIAKPHLVLKAGDQLLLYATEEAIRKFCKAAGLCLSPTKHLELDPSHLAEVLLTPDSRLLHQTVHEAGFREKYELTVLAIRHGNRDARAPEREEKLAYGDALLVHGKWKDIKRLAEEKGDTVVLRHAAEASTVEKAHPGRLLTAGVILLAMLAAMATEVLPAVLIVVLTAVLMLLTGCIRQADQAYRSINWQTVVLIACMLPVATALEKTGGVAFLSEGLIRSLGAVGPLAVLAGLYLITSLFSQFISNTATAVLLYPVAILTAEQLSVSPVPLVMAVAFSTSMAFATPIATPPNAMVLAAGRYTFLDFVRVGVPLQLLIAVIAVALLPIFFPF